MLASNHQTPVDMQHPEPIYNQWKKLAPLFFSQILMHKSIYQKYSIKKKIFNTISCNIDDYMKTLKWIHLHEYELKEYQQPSPQESVSCGREVWPWCYLVLCDIMCWVVLSLPLVVLVESLVLFGIFGLWCHLRILWECFPKLLIPRFAPNKSVWRFLCMGIPFSWIF